ncbi:D-erythronate dehydrogenase [Tropicimonas sp. IMCC34043]|uniref:D-erythronate dehydrogenase n=1 Tax=Tropicimonas sp. IMCC34043 TaxID=2248760 RepID=UPI000E2406CB|nr:D-erythronate dehydrogenase [Tropicimonas sp. IMCC34043]
MRVVVTGGAGFLGSRLIEALLTGGGLPGKGAVESILSFDRVACPVKDPRVESRIGSIDDPDCVAAALSGEVDVVYHLAAVLSGQSEAEFETGLHINVDATRLLLEACRKLPRPPRFILTSSLAVFGGPMPEVVPETLAPMPQSSYGVGKAIGELLVCEYSRKGFVDGIVCRLPTIAVRPGKPNSAASSFVSGIIREPLNGEDSACPVPLDTRLWISSPETAIANLVLAGGIEGARLGINRVLNLPGITVTAAEMLDSLTRLAGQAARDRVALTSDPKVIDIVCSWPGAFDVARPVALGFVADTAFDAVVRQYMDGLPRQIPKGMDTGASTAV